MARNGEIDDAALARQVRKTPPGLAFGAGVKKPETGSGFWDWWRRRPPNYRPALSGKIHSTISRSMP
jgi:hypothetical protein